MVVLERSMWWGVHPIPPLGFVLKSPSGKWITFLLFYSELWHRMRTIYTWLSMMFQSPRVHVTENQNLLTCFPFSPMMIMMKTNKKDPFLNTWKFQFSYSFMAPLLLVVLEPEMRPKTLFTSFTVFDNHPKSRIANIVKKMRLFDEIFKHYELLKNFMALVLGQMWSKCDNEQT